MLSAILSLVAIASIAVAAPQPHPHVHHDARSLPARWYQDDDHPAHALFRRQSPGTETFPTVGSPQWSAGFPQTADTKTMPQAWTDALNAAINASLIPSNVPVSTQSNPSANPTYGGQDPNKLPICSATYQCRIDGQIWDAPNGTVGISFDDGPLPPSDGLYQFLQQNNIPSTHFYIGTNILQYPKEFLFAFQTLQSDIAVHTWTHPYMTTLSNEQVVAELGWTMLLIYNSTGGRLPRYWRPPYGDSDGRVTAIAKEVFGLTTVVWNQDTEDWSLGESGGTTQTAINSNFDKWLSGSKSPGLIILEHELMNTTVQAFETNFPKFAQYGWKLQSVAQIQGASYQNAQSSNSSVFSAAITAGGNGGAGLQTPTPTPSPASAASATGGNNAAQASSSGAAASGSAAPHDASTSGASTTRASFSIVVALASAVFFARLL